MFTKNANYYLPYFAIDVYCPISDSGIISIGGTAASAVYNSKNYQQGVSYSKISNMMNGSFFDTRYFADNNTNGTSYGILFGTGNTQPTVDDITLSGDAVPIASFSKNHTYKSAYKEDCVEISTIITLTNNTEAAITIGEIGLFSNFYYEYDSSSYYPRHYYPFMIERTALETPITIPAGGVGQVTYTIRMNYPVV